MPKDTSPVCFRLPSEDRQLLELVAEYQGQSISTFVREIVMSAARRIVDETGGEKIVQELDERNEQLAEEQREAREKALRGESAARRR